MEPKSNFDSRTILVILVCMGVWFGWQRYLENKYPEAMNPAATPAPATTKTEPLSKLREKPLLQPDRNAEVVSSDSQPVGPEKTWGYEDSAWRVTVSSRGGRVSEIVLKNYTDRESKPITLVSTKEPGYLLTDVSGAVSVPFSKLNFDITPLSKDSVQLTASQSGVTIKKTLTIVPEKYIVKDETVIGGKVQGLQNIALNISQPAPLESQAQSGATSFLNRGAGQEIQEYFFNHGTKADRKLTTFKDPFDKTYEQTHFASLGSRYFTTLLFNRGDVLPTGTAFKRETYSFLNLNYSVQEKNEPVTLNLDLYAGPKLLNQLKQVDEQAAQVVDFGFFSWIALPLLELMKFLYKIFNNYGVAIIALTILVRGVTFPFTYVSFKSMKAMQRIQPEIKRLKEIYKDNTQQLNQETMKLMRENKVNPAGGCLPLLLQLPIFWALYQVLQNSIELYHSPFLGWIHDLSMKDPFYVLPILMCLSMVMQQKLTPNTMDPSQAKVMMFMPVFFGFLMMSLPAGLTLYIFVSTLFGIIQQLFMMRERGQTGQPALVRKA